MFQRQRSGSLLCPSCGRLVGASEKQCPYCGRRHPGMFGWSAELAKLGRDLGFVDVVFGGCVLLYVLMLIADPHGIQMGGITSLLGPSTLAELRFGAAGAIPVFALGRWWTVISAGWLHAGLLHIGFNLYWVRFLAPAVAELYGASRMIIIYTAASVAGFLLSSVMQTVFHGAGLTLGASAPILGMVGALAYYGRRSGSRAIGSQAWSYAVTMLIFGFLMRGVDNYAHIGGFAGGYLTALLLDPLKPERGNHQVIALACLAATAASVVASLVVPLPPQLLRMLG
jgi:rhomboid protease GluP